MAVAPPRPRLPPLNALRAFEAAARLGGFRAAAEELCVTPGAVAQQVRALEGYLGAPLFRRQARGVALTALGQGALAHLGPVFDRLGEAVSEIRAEAVAGELRIAALPAVGQLWLAPRLPALRARFPGLELSLTALEAPPNFKREPFDLALFFGPEGLVLTADALLPVAAPALAEAIAAGADMAAYPWLADATWAGDWALWLARAGRPARRTRPQVYSLFALAVAEAEAGAGVLMAHAPLVARQLADGRLVALPGPRVALPHALVATSPHDLAGESPAARLARALVELA